MVAFLLGVARVDPRLDDDFAFAWSVAHLRATGEYRIHNWVAPNPPFWIGLGAVVQVDGAEYTSLHLLPVAFGVLAVAGAYAVARECALSATLAGVVALGLASSRLFVSFSCTFLTDIPFLACLLWSVALYARLATPELPARVGRGRVRGRGHIHPPNPRPRPRPLTRLDIRAK